MKSATSNFKRLMMLIVGVLIVFYAFDVYLKRTGDVIFDLPSNDGLYKAKIVEVRKEWFSGDTKYLVMIYDAKGSLLKSIYKSNFDLGNVGWVCLSGKCSSFIWGPGDGYVIDVPPSSFDRFISLIP